LVRAGAFGVSLLLGATVPCDAGEPPSTLLPSATQGMSERLATIREAVSELRAPSINSRESEQRLTWGNWWHNGGWHNGGWAIGATAGITVGTIGEPAVAPNAVKAMTWSASKVRQV